MKISLNWLKDYVDINIPTDQLAHKLTMAGLEVENIETIAGDKVLELEITPNRADCLSMIGIAREISAVLNKTLKCPRLPTTKRPVKRCDIAIENKKDCPRYIGTVIEDVKIAASSKKIAERLQSLGVRLINDVVDITNFSMLENGQPLHVFDYDQLIGKKIIVRRAKAGEEIVTIDGVLRKLDPSILVIADEKRAVAIAGVMGGKVTEVTERTKNILLESAYFEPILIRRASRKLGLSSDSCYRFERGVDIHHVEWGCRRALGLIQESAKGRVVSQSDVFAPQLKVKATGIKISLGQIQGLIGAEIPLARCQNILKKLGCVVIVKGQALNVKPPSFRSDLRQEVDLIEEIARVIGYDQLPVSLPAVPMVNLPICSKRGVRNKIRQSLVSLGLDEVVGFSLIHQEVLDKSQAADLKGLALMNPLTQDQSILRPSLLPSLLSIVQTNLNRGQDHLRLFELGKIYCAGEEKEVLAMIMTGPRFLDWRQEKKERLDFFDIKGILSALFERVCDQNELSFSADEDQKIFLPGQAASVVCNAKSIGFIGKLDPTIIKNWDLTASDVYFAEIDLGGLLQESVGQQSFKKISEYPLVQRHVSLALSQEHSFQKVRDLIWKKQSSLLKDIQFIEQYRGDKIPNGQRGLVFSLIYQSDDRTLTEEEVTQEHNQICKSFVQELQATIR